MTTEFRVNDRVSVEGTVTQVLGDEVMVRVDTNYYFSPEVLTLVERPRKKLRVGSVWHPPGFPTDRYMVIGYEGSDGTEEFLDIRRGGGIHCRDQLTFDSSRAPWREIPVEELEQEAQ